MTAQFRTLWSATCRSRATGARKPARRAVTTTEANDFGNPVWPLHKAAVVIATFAP